MRKPLFYLLIVLAIITPAAYTFTQTKGSLSGMVADSSKKPLSFVTVRLFKQNDATPLQTVVSAESGVFNLNNPGLGTYALSFTHTGFAEKKQDITVNTNGDMKIDVVELSPTTGTLNEVVVKTSRPLIEQGDDKIVFNVEDDQSAKSETAIDILRRTPFISVDGEDNVKVNGKDNFKVLLNDRETPMFARNIKEALRGFPGALISKIEVITAPSAKYDGEGIGGLINIITKKKVAGYNGTISTFNRTSDKVNEYSINGNAKVGKFGASVFFSAGYQDPLSQYNINTTIPTITTAYAKRVLEGNQVNSAGWSYGNAELVFEADSLNTISLYTNIDSWSSKTVSNQTITTDFSSAPSSVSLYDLYNKSNNPGINIGSDYIKHFKKKKDQEFSLRFLGEFGKNDAEINSSQSNPDYEDDRFLRNNSHAINNQYTIQADNSIPIKKNGKLDAGVKAILRSASSDFESLEKYGSAVDYKLNPLNTDKFTYKQDVLSAYGMYTLKIKKSTFRLGVRAEFTDVNGNFISSNTQVKSNYVTLLPNIQFTNRLSGTTTLVLSYNKRLQRPYIYDLNPFVFNNDSLNISSGNPDLGPQTVHAVAAQLRYGKGNTFGGINVEGSYSNNKILQYSFFDPQTGVTNTTSLNIGKEFQSSLNINLSTKITPKWRIFMNASLRFATVTNNSDKSQSNTGLGGSFNFNTSYQVTNKFNISSYVGLWKDPQTIQTTYPFSTWHNVAFNFKVFKDKLNISLRAVNYYQKTWDSKTIVKDPNFYSTNILRFPRRAAVVALTWNFGKLSENVSKKKGVDNDDILTKPTAPGGN